MLRIILIIGNALCGIFMIYMIFSEGLEDDNITNLFIISVTMLFLLNTFFLFGILNKSYMKRKKLEEEIKIQEAENRLKELKNKKGD